MPKLLWNLYALCYDTIAGLSPYQDMLDEVVTSLELSPGMRVMDAGCGTGALADRLAAKHPDIDLMAVDLSSSMLKRARSRRAWPPSFTFVEGNIDDTLAQDARGFDRIASVNVIWTLPDPQRTFERMTTGLRPGGRMVHTTPRWHFHPQVIVWNHLRRQKGWAFLRALFVLPVLLCAGLLNLLLVLQSLLLASGPRAGKRWDADGLIELFRAAGVPPCEVRPCYAGQGNLIVLRKNPEEVTASSGTRLPGPGNPL